jgi:hypothetical protein
MTPELQERGEYAIASTIYQAKDEYPNKLQDPEGYEYKVFLLEDGEVVDSWDSLHKFVSGDSLAHLQSVLAAKEAVKRIEEDVENGFAFHWFDVPRDRVTA